MFRDQPNLQPLIEQYGPEAVWRAGIEANGFPPTLQLGGNHLVKVAEFLSSNS